MFVPYPPLVYFRISKHFAVDQIAIILACGPHSFCAYKVQVLLEHEAAIVNT